MCGFSSSPILFKPLFEGRLYLNFISLDADPIKGWLLEEGGIYWRKFSNFKVDYASPSFRDF